MAISSEYIAYTGLLLDTGKYIDTGEYPSDDQSIEMLFCGQSLNGYIFGARNTNSNASPGQVNVFVNYNSNGSGALNYLGYVTQRLSVSDTNTGDNIRLIRYAKEKNELQLAKGTLVLNTLGLTTEFTGNRTMYIGALNNAGTPMYRSAGSLYFIGGTINGESVIPVYYDNYVDQDYHNVPASGVQIGPSMSFSKLVGADGMIGMYRYVAVGSAVGGKGIIKLYTGDRVDEVLCYDVEPLWPHMIAEASEGYVFKNWTDEDGNVVSTDSEFWYRPTQEVMLLYPNFERKTEIDAGTGFRTLALKYGETYPPSLEDDLYANIVNASIVFDTMQKVTSTIELEEVPSAYQINTPIFILNPKGKVIYEGVIKSIEGNTLTCREPLSIFDCDCLLHANANTFAKTTLENAMYQLMTLAAEYSTDDSVAGYDLLNLSNRMYDKFTFSFKNRSRVNQINILNPTPPLITAVTVENLEDYFIDTFGNSGVYPKAELVKLTRTILGEDYEYHRMNLEPVSMEDRELLVLADNDENLKNISVSSESENYTLLIVFNAAGTSIRAGYSIKKNGQIGQMSIYEVGADDIAYTDYNVKIIASNDDLYGLVKEYLARGQFNDSITFTKIYQDGCDFDDIKFLQPVEFHFNDKIYRSIVTGWKFSINSNQNKIMSVDYVLGNVRTNLTSFINMKRKK